MMFVVVCGVIIICDAFCVAPHTDVKLKDLVINSHNLRYNLHLYIQTSQRFCILPRNLASKEFLDRRCSLE